MSPANLTLRKLDSAESLAQVAAEECLRLAREAVSSCGRFSMALAGGSTPRRVYDLLARKPSVAAFPWAETHFFWGDERHVPPDHPDSNYRMVFETMLSRVPVRDENIHRFCGENPDAIEAAAEYEQTLASFFSTGSGDIPILDLVLLGMGDDGHTASLFPGTEVLGEKTRPAAAVWVPKFSAFRLTLTVPLFNRAKNVVFLVSGADKAEALRAVLSGEFEPQRFPAQLIRPDRGQLVWLIDHDAAQLL